MQIQDPAIDQTETAAALDALLAQLRLSPALLREAVALLGGLVAEGAGCAFQSWVLALPLKQQCCLMAAVRGPDEGTPVGRELVRRLRAATLRRADKKASFMSTELAQVDLAPLEYGSMHFVVHLRSAARRIARAHPEADVAAYWQSVVDQLDSL